MLIRILISIALFAISAGAGHAADPSINLKSRLIGRFKVDLPTGSDWQVVLGGHFVTISSILEIDGRRLFFWVGTEANNYPENRYDWLAPEVAREVRDFEALRLIEGVEETGYPLDLLEYGEEFHSERLSYNLKWAQAIFNEELGRELSEYQELHLFFPVDHARDHSYLAIYFGANCLTDCPVEALAADLILPILEAVEISSVD